MKETIARTLAGTIEAMARCEGNGNTEWHAKHRERILRIVGRTGPSGSGVDSGTKIDLERSTSERIVFTLSFHHMDEFGSYDGWTNHEVVVTASLAHGLTLKVKGNDRNHVKEHLHAVYDCWLNELCDPTDFLS